MDYKYTNYSNGLIETYDHFLDYDKFLELHEKINKLSYNFGESHGPDTAPTGMISDLNDSDIHDYLYEQVKNLDSLKELTHVRTYVNRFAPMEENGYHNDNTAKTVLFYFNLGWDLDEGGETKFSIDAQDLEGIETKGAEDFPVILSIAPIPNRMVIFNGDLIHSASPFKHHSRFTLAMKFQKEESQ